MNKKRSQDRFFIAELYDTVAVRYIKSNSPKSYKSKFQYMPLNPGIDFPFMIVFSTFFFNGGQENKERTHNSHHN